MFKVGSKASNLIISIAIIGVTAFMVINQKDFLALNLIYFALFPATLVGGTALLMVIFSSIFIGVVLANLSLPQVLVFAFPLSFTGSMLMIFKSKIDSLAGGLGNISLVDGETGLYNFIYFKDRLKEEKERSDRLSSKVSVIMVEIDELSQAAEISGFFKRVADIINEQVRAVDIVSRHGVGRFAVILPNTSSEAVEIAERIRAAVEAADFEGGKVTVSAALASYPANAENEKDLIERVEKTLEAAVAAGRNRVLVYKD